MQSDVNFPLVLCKPTSQIIQPKFNQCKRFVLHPHFSFIYLTISILGSSIIFGLSLKYTLRFVPSKWVYYEQNKLLKLEVFEEISWLDKDQNPCLDNYYHTFFYRIDEQGRIVRLRKGKIVPYKYNHSDHAYDSYLKAAHKRFALQFTPYSERHMK